METLVKVGPDNLAECGIGCLTNPKNQGYGPKVAWLKDRFDEGLRFFLFRDEHGKPLGFLEYVPGEFAWRPVDAKGWVFIHCLWVYGKGRKIGGLGARLIQACIDEARRTRALGVAAIVSRGPWMADERVFLNNDFVEIDRADRFRLLVHRLKVGPDPKFRQVGSSKTAKKGLHIVYADQCPMLHKSVRDLSEMAAEHGLTLHVTKLDSAGQAQNAPAHYGVYSLMWHGRVLADHYVSKGRFKNILKKEILRE